MSIQFTDIMGIMSSRNSTAGITFQEGKGYKKCIGWYRHADGRKLPKIHWLGRDPKHAQYLAMMLQQTWQMIEREGRGWTPDDICHVKQWVAEAGELLREALKGVDEQEKEIKKRREEFLLAARILPNASTAATGQASLPPSDTPPATDASKVPTLYGAIAAFKEAMKGKQSSDKHKQRAIQVVEVNLKASRKDCPLADIDYAWIDSLCDYYKGRPKNLKDEKPMAPAGVANVLRYLRLFFVWVDDSEWGQWQSPRKLLKPFRVRQSDLMTTSTRA